MHCAALLLSLSSAQPQQRQRPRPSADGLVCAEDGDSDAAVFSRQRSTCTDFCVAAIPAGTWICRGAQDVNAGCAEFRLEHLRQNNCEMRWGTKICHCVDGRSEATGTAKASAPEAAAAAAAAVDDEAPPAESPATASRLQVWEGVLPPALLSLAIARHRAMRALAKTPGSGSRADRSLGWIDARAEPEAVGAFPRDYMEAIVSSVISAVPELRELRHAGSLDVVEFFSHDRPQQQPQWFHFDTAEYAPARNLPCMHVRV